MMRFILKAILISTSVYLLCSCSAKPTNQHSFKSECSRVLQAPVEGEIMFNQPETSEICNCAYEKLSDDNLIVESSRALHKIQNLADFDETETDINIFVTLTYCE